MLRVLGLTVVVVLVLLLAGFGPVPVLSGGGSTKLGVLVSSHGVDVVVEEGGGGV